MPYWILIAAVVANHGSITCDTGVGPLGPDGSRCHLKFDDTKYPSLNDCRSDAPTTLKREVAWGDVTITWSCEKRDPEAERRQIEQSIIIKHDGTREQP